MREASKHVLAFYEHIGRLCRTLGDLNWSETSSYLDQIPTDLERVDFLQELAQLPDDGIVNNTIVDPAKHNLITNTLIRPLNNECSRLLARHFNLDNILKEAERISAHAEAIDFLWLGLRAFKKYHPGTQNNHYLPHELRFCQRIEDEIQYRKDVQAASGSSIHYSITVDENRGNIQQGGIGNSQSIGGQKNEIK